MNFTINTYTNETLDIGSDLGWAQGRARFFAKDRGEMVKIVHTDHHGNAEAQTVGPDGVAGKWIDIPDHPGE